MKRLLFVLSLLFLAIDISAQSNVAINVENYRFSYRVRTMPKKILNPVFFHYATLINMPSSVSLAVDEMSLYENLKINGMRITDDPSNQDVIITVKFGGLNIKSTEIKERYEERKDKYGKVIGAGYYYSMLVNYEFSANAIVTQGGVEIAKYTAYRSSENQTYRSGEYSSSKGASRYWNNNNESIKDQLIREMVEKSIASFTKSLNKDFSFRTEIQSNLIKTVKGKNHPENYFIRDNSTALKKKLEKQDGTVPLQESEIADIIKYFKNIPVKYADPDAKAHIRFRYIAYYNLCKIYLLLDQPDKVYPYADLITQNGYDKKDGERMRKDADKLIQRFRNSPVKSRQFNPDDYYLD